MNISTDSKAKSPGKMSEYFRTRLINLWLGGCDRGSNDFQTLLHLVSEYLEKYATAAKGVTYSRLYWLHRILTCLNRSQLCDSSMRLLRFEGYDEVEFLKKR